MSINCNGDCCKFKASKPAKFGRYASGQKRCNTSEIFLQWDGHWCPCCGRSLRTRPRTSRYKKLFFVNTKLMTNEISNFTRTVKSYPDNDHKIEKRLRF